MSDWKILGFGVLVAVAGYGIMRIGEDSGNSFLKNIGGLIAASPLILMLVLLSLGAIATVLGILALPFLFVWKLFS